MNLWYVTVKKVVAWGLRRYFREVRIQGAHHIPETGGVLFTVNHQNAFLDALLVATTNNRFTNFLVRADVFQSSILNKVFKSLNMFPIYRWRDGRHALANNHEIFNSCIERLNRQEALLLFPEANHHQLRRLLSLSKGFTRITSGVDQKNNPLKIVPVGLNYTHHRSMGGSVTIIYGEPLSPPLLDPGSRVNMAELRDHVTQNMQMLITHIPVGLNYQPLEDHLNLKPWNYLDPDLCNVWIKENEHNDLEPANHVANSALRKIIIAVSFIFNFPPLALNYLILYLIGDPVFSSSIKVLIGLFIFPIYYLLITFALIIWLGITWAVVGTSLAVLTMLLRKWSLKLQK